LRLGAPAQIVNRTGNTKFDVVLLPGADYQLEEFRDLLPLSAGPLWILASTHHDEEAQILSRCNLLWQRFPNLQILIAPRHAERAGAIVKIAERLGLRVVRRSGLPKRGMTNPNGVNLPQVILLDTIGELQTVLGLADLVFVGGSLVKKGG